MIKVSVMYPSQKESFNFDYYIEKHIPLVHKLLTPYGLVKTEVDKGIASAGPGTSPPFIAVAHLIFKSIEKMNEGLQAHDPTLALDLPNFTKIKPQFQISEIVANTDAGV